MGSMEEFIKNGATQGTDSISVLSNPKRELRESKLLIHKLWINVPTNPPPPTATTSSERVIPIRPTVTTLLRHHQVLDKQEKKDRIKVEAFLQGNVDFDHKAWRDALDAEEQKKAQINDKKRVLKAKLAYHKAIAASQNVKSEKSEYAQYLRDEGQQLREEREARNMKELERRRNLAAKIQDVQTNSRQMVQMVQEEKKRQAFLIKEQKKRVRAETKRKELEDFITRKDKIYQIQASKQALRVANNGSLSCTQASNFIGAIGSPDIEVRLKVNKEKAEEDLEERRRKVQQVKAEREQKLLNVKKRLERSKARSEGSRKLQRNFKALPDWKHPPGDMEDGEIAALVLQLDEFKGIGTGKETAEKAACFVRRLK